MDELIRQIPEDALRVNFLMVGVLNRASPSFSQTQPFTVLSHTLTGGQQVRCGGVRTHAAAGEVFLVQSNVPMRITHRADGEGRFLVHWLHIYFTLFGTVDFVRLLQIPAKVVGRPARQLGEAMAEMIDLAGEEGDRRLRGLVRCRELAYRVLGLLCEAGTVHADGLDLLYHPERLVAVLRYIDEHLAEPISAADLADAANLSRSQFHVFFKKHMGESPMGYIRRVRLERARQLLATTDRPVYAVAEAVGFTNPFHFSRAFKFLVGMSPSEYRRQVWSGSQASAIGR